MKTVFLILVLCIIASYSIEVVPTERPEAYGFPISEQQEHELQEQADKGFTWGNSFQTMADPQYEVTESVNIRKSACGDLIRTLPVGTRASYKGGKHYQCCFGGCYNWLSFSTDGSNLVWAIESCWKPVGAPSTSKFRLPFRASGIRVTQGPGSAFSHSGISQHAIDFGTPSNTPIVAAKDGTVAYIKRDSSSGCCSTSCSNQANYVTITHDGYATAYWHLSSVSVSVGQRVTQGQEIGRSGNTGYSCGAHLHFQKQVLGGAYTQTISVDKDFDVGNIYGVNLSAS